eukprot:m51a1_g1219 hypothetical protein (289) ;mRNA; r:495737-496719
MPLVVVSGLPASGKTRVAERIAACASARAARPCVLVVSDASVGLARSSPAFSGTAVADEQSARGLVRSAVERALARSSDVVVCDSALCNTKGYRYELGCLAKARGTATATVYCQCTPAEAAQRDRERAEGSRYGDESVAALVARFEKPSEAYRWDRPLFVAETGCDADEVAARVVSELLDAPARAMRRNMATAEERAGDAVAVHGLDRACSEAAATIVRACNDAAFAPGDRVHVGASAIRLPRRVGAAELAALRRQFVRLSESGAQRASVAAFIAFVGCALGTAVESQ